MTKKKEYASTFSIKLFNTEKFFSKFCDIYDANNLYSSFLLDKVNNSTIVSDAS